MYLEDWAKIRLSSRQICFICLYRKKEIFITVVANLLRDLSGLKIIFKCIGVIEVFEKEWVTSDSMKAVTGHCFIFPGHFMCKFMYPACVFVYLFPFNLTPTQNRLVLFESQSTSQLSGAPQLALTVRWSLTRACPSLWPGRRMTSLSSWDGGNGSYADPQTSLVLLSYTRQYIKSMA